MKDHQPGQVSTAKTSMDALFAITLVAAHVCIYWPTAVLVPENGHFQALLASVGALKQRKPAKS
ncbi:MAG: hypothetical protein V4451_18435 [Pseudomonadota bacterium]